ncbi:SAVMC3_10250 family protein [Streptomyces roseoverticillatus]|uniref:SAVMC3_10250 family protein n=1 Tax=Streptomyces roseoverticillatus TaxID=66429 RepID=UPI0022867537|nr:SAVMC3_10250 family protein [Streptomyces roseoverticillatus]
MRERELLYLSTAKLDEFYRAPENGFVTRRAAEAETSVLGIGVRVSVGEEPAGEVSPGARLEQVVSHIREKCWAHTRVPGSCESLMARDWIEFTGPFRYGPGLRDWGLLDRGVYTYASLEDSSCSLRDREECSGVELILCGSAQHVLEHRDCAPKRMGSGSDWLHDLAADLVNREAQGDTSMPDSLASTSRRDQEFAARSCYAMLSRFANGGPAYLHGHARVLCNFPPERLEHRLIVATPLYLEAGPRPQPAGITASTKLPISRSWWRRLLRWQHD